MTKQANYLSKVLRRALARGVAASPVLLPSQARSLATQVEDKSVELGELKRNASAVRRKVFQGALHAMSLEPSGLLWTPPKTGTTYLLNLYLNYLNHFIQGRSDQVERSLLLSAHTIEREIATGGVGRSLEQLRALHGEDLPLRFLVHTHKTPTLGRFQRTICITRNPLDVMVSHFYWFGKNRGTERTMEETIRSSLPSFIETYRAQQALFGEAPERIRIYQYRDLVSEPKTTLRNVLDFLCYPLNEESLAVAVRNSSIEAVKRLENETKQPLVPAPNFLAHSFIRNGSVGEWREHLSPAQVDLTLTNIRAMGVDPEVAWPEETTR